ncbi:MAG: hypothetical protein RLZZ06_593 [Actinomycetota bacterium]|jgi:hypothetical protein
MKFLKKLAVIAATLLVLTPTAASADDTYDVKIIKGSAINLVSQASRVPILIQNNYDTEVRVLVHVSPSNLRVRLPETTSVTIAPNSTVNAVVPVQAVANGDVELSVWLTTFSGDRIGPDQVITMHVIGNAEAIALGTMGGLVLILLVIGSVRMVRRRKLAE